jgi:hypothetical protein
MSDINGQFETLIGANYSFGDEWKSQANATTDYVNDAVESLISHVHDAGEACRKVVRHPTTPKSQRAPGRYRPFGMRDL